MNTETESTNTALMPLEKKNAVQYFVPNGLDPILTRLRTEVDAFVPDISTKAGREVIASFAYKLARSKTAVDNLGKSVVSEMKEKVKVVDAERARAWDEIEAMQKKVRQPLTDWEEAEKARVAGHEEAIQKLATFGKDAKTYDEFVIALADLLEYAAQRDWQEFSDRAAAAKKAEEERIAKEAADKARKEAEEKADREKHEIEERAAAEKKAKEDAERKAAEEKAAREKAEADAKAAAEKAEADKKAAAEKAEREKQEAAERAAAAERQRIADEQAAAAKETARREADEAHRSGIWLAAFDAVLALVNDASDRAANPHDLATNIMNAIAAGQVPHTKINY